MCDIEVDCMGQGPQIDKVIFWKNRPDTFAPPPAQPNWEAMDIKQRLYNTLIPIPDLFGVKWEVLVNIECVYRLPSLQHRDKLDMTLAANVAVKRTGGWPTKYRPVSPILLQINLELV